jgi:hypothetical protein
MVAGDATRRASTIPIPDPPLSLWGPNDTTPLALAQKAVGFNCLNYRTPPEGALRRHSFPSRLFIDSQCLDGLRFELMFPSCWDGIHLTAQPQRPHVAYPNLVMEGSCPDGFKVRIPALYYETIWSTETFRGADGGFVLSNGDQTGTAA